MTESRTFDLNNPKDARDYLTLFEKQGMLIFEDLECSQDLDDKRAIALARSLFLKINKPDHPPQ